MENFIDRDVQYYLRTGALRDHTEPRHLFLMDFEDGAPSFSGSGPAPNPNVDLCPPDILAEIENELDL